MTAPQSAIVVFCLESAAMSCGTSFEFRDDAIKYAGLNKKEYGRQKKTFDKLLGLDRQLQLKDICLQLDLPQTIQSMAQRLLKAHEMSAKFTDDIQSAHCLTMAVYQCCRRQKIKSVKNKLCELSNLDKSQWKRLEEQWDKWIVSAEPFKEKSMPTANDESGRNVNIEYTAAVPLAPAVKIDEEKTQSYEEWKKAMLDRAMADRNKLNETSQNEITIESI